MHIPYEKQPDEPPRLMCGAAALCMVYRSYGLELTQESVWPYISRSGFAGQKVARTYLLAADALRHGLTAVVFQAKDPWPTLRRCLNADLRVIVNHAIGGQRFSGHYSVLTGCDDDGLTLHDPLVGPDRRLTKSEFLELWQPRYGRGDVVGNILVAFADHSQWPTVCAECGHVNPTSWVCSICRKDCPLQPLAGLGCTQKDCARRVWQRLYCPYCDREIWEVPLANAASV